MASPSFPDVHLTGAVHHFVRALTSTIGGKNYYYLGTAEITPQMQRRKVYQDVMNDKAGKTLPLQRTYDGESATISVLLTYFSNLAWSVVLDAGSAVGVELPVGGGTETRWSRGGAVFGVRTFELWQVFENALNPLTRTGRDPALLEVGWYWPQVQLIEHNDPKLGTQGRGLLLVMDAQPVLQAGIGHTEPGAYLGGGQFGPPAVTVSGNPGGWMLYSNDPADFPPDVLVFQ